MRDWVVHPKNDTAHALASELKIHPAIVEIILRRGIAPSEIYNFLNPSLAALQDPFVFQDRRRPSNASARPFPKKKKFWFTAITTWTG